MPIFKKQIKCDHNYEEFLKVENDDIVLDVGASEGCFSLNIKDKARLIIALEPNPFYYYPFKEKIRTLNLQNKIILIKEGAYNKRSLLQFNIKGQESSIIINEPMLIEVDRIDEILYYMGIDYIDFIKMDIEGAEIEALEGASNILNNTRKIVVSAYHERNDDMYHGKTYKWVNEYLQYKGFNTHVGKDYLVHGHKHS